MSVASLVATGLPDLLPQRQRAPGLHISSIIRDMSIAFGHFADDPDRSVPANLMKVGQLVEHGLAHALMTEYPGRYYREWDDEFQYWKNGMQLVRHEKINGIWQPVTGNLDLWRLGAADDTELIDRVGPGVTCVEDCKFTRKSPDHDIDGPSWWAAWLQVASYCHMIGAKVGGIWIVYTGSSWAAKREKNSPGDYDARLWWRVWNDGELDECWGRLISHANENYDRITARQNRKDG